MVSRISDDTHVLLHGAYDVGLAAAEILQRQPCGNGPYSAAAYRDNHGNQPEVLHKRL